MEKYGIYVHIPFCKARCGYCAFSSCIDYSLVDKYFNKLFEEIDYYADSSKQIYTIYVGGGTPSSVDIRLLNELFDKLRVRFDMSRVQEISVECNPESVTEQLLRCLMSNGVNRLSFGLQSVNDTTLKRIGRLHNYAQFDKSLRLARQLGFDNINADLIVGLPESVQEFYHSVDTVAKLPLQHVSVYALELHEGTSLYKLCNEQYSFNEDELADMYDYACQQLSANGFVRYEISNFAKVGQECKHNLNYWSEGRYFAFGASAGGFVDNTRFTNPYGIRDYISAPLQALHNNSQTLSLYEQANEYVMLGLRLNSGVNLTEFCENYGKDFFEFFSEASKLVEQGFLSLENGSVRVPTDKLYVVNSILCELLNFDEK